MRFVTSNQTQCFRALLHHIHLTCASMQTYPNEMYPPKLNPVIQNPTTPCQFDVEACRHTQMRFVPPNQTQCCRALLHHVYFTCTRMLMYPGQIYPPKWTQYYTHLLHHMSLTCGHIHMNPGTMYPLPKQTKCYTLLLHHVSLTCQWMHMLPDHMYPSPAKQTQCFMALLQHVHLTCASMQTYPNEICLP